MGSLSVCIRVVDVSIIVVIEFIYQTLPHPRHSVPNLLLSFPLQKTYFTIAIFNFVMSLLSQKKSIIQNVTTFYPPVYWCKPTFPTNYSISSCLKSMGDISSTKRHLLTVTCVLFTIPPINIKIYLYIHIHS